MNRSEVQRYIEERFPGCAAKSKITIPCRNSKIFRLDLDNGQSSERIVVKIARNYKPREVALEFANLSRFFLAAKPITISAPRPLLVDEKKGILAMSYVPGINLAHMLHEIRTVSPTYLDHAIDLSATALAEYHAIFHHKEGKSVFIDRAAPEDDINRFLSQSSPVIADCSLKTMVTPFFDFTPWNIIINDTPRNGGMMLYLIDFPRTNYICTPHLDLARFRFSLELTKQFPPAKFLGINRWEVESTFDQFLKGYCREMHVSLNGNDFFLIDSARKAYIRRAQDLARKGQCGWQPKIEKAYLQTFSHQWLDKKSISSQWPMHGRAMLRWVMRNLKFPWPMQYKYVKR
jgi:hypothetical protein